MMWKLSVLFLILGVAHGMLPELAGEEGTLDYRALQAELDYNRALWEASVGSVYQMTLKRSCFCVVQSLGPFEVTVVDGEVFSVVPDNEFSDNLPTVDGVFDFIQEAIDDKAVVINVQYDDEAGYPAEVYVDQSALLADEELGYTISVTLLPDVHPEPEVCDPEHVNMFQLYKSKRFDLLESGFRFGSYISALRRWQRLLKKIGCSYTYKFMRSCFCQREFVGPFIITVKNSRVVGAVYEDPKMGEVSDEVLKGLPTISELFAVIFDEAQKADKVDIDYDRSTGVPERAFFDRISGAIDDEITYLAELH